MSAQKQVKENPNASVAGLTTGVAAIVVWVAGVAGLEMDAVTATAFAGVLITAVLYVGRRSG